MSEEGLELRYIQDAFDSNWLSTVGEHITGFEDDLKQFSGAKHVTALASGTAALHLAALLSGVSSGGRIFCQDLTFIASVNPALYLNAEPIFIDSERDTWNMDPRALELAFRRYGRPAAVVAVDLYGMPAKLDEIAALCARYNVPLIEDAAEALGSTYRDIPCGRWGTYGVWSFNGNKIISASVGGALLSPIEEDAARAVKLASQAKENTPWYEHREPGYNYRLSNICAAMGRGQMKQLRCRVESRRRIFDLYRTHLASLPLVFQPEQAASRSNRWLTAALVAADGPVSPDGVIDALERENIECRRLWKPMHLQPLFRGCSFVSAAPTPVSEDLFARGFCLPSGSSLTDGEQARVCGALRRCFGG